MDGCACVSTEWMNFYLFVRCTWRNQNNVTHIMYLTVSNVFDFCTHLPMPIAQLYVCLRKIAVWIVCDLISLSLFSRDIRLNPYAAGLWQLYQNLTAIDSYSSNETTRLSGLNGENRTRFFTMQFALNCTTHCMSIIVPIVHSTIRTTCNFSQFEVWRWHFLVFLLKFLATN